MLITPEQLSRNISGGFLIVKSQIGESSVMRTSESKKQRWRSGNDESYSGY
jgi:hypothetical protein